MLLHIAFLGELVKLSEHAAVVHIMSVDHRAAVGKITAASVIDIDAARRQIFLFVGLKEILLVVPAAEHRIADVCTLYINPADDIIVYLRQGLEVHFRHPNAIRVLL